MLTVLKIAGIVALLMLILAILGVRWLLRKLRGIIEENMPVPCRINPEPEPSPQWRNAAAIRKFADGFRALGFQEIGAFSIPELGGLQFLGFHHPTERLYGCAYDHKKIPPNFDIVCSMPDDTSVTGTNTRLGEALEQRPGRTTLRMENATVAEVFEAVRLHPLVAGERTPTSAERFAPYFKQAYAEYSNWRLRKGGTNRDEIRRQAEQNGQEVTDSDVEDVYQDMRTTYVEQLRDGCIAQYLDEARLSAAEWERQQQSVLAIPETLELKEVVETLNDSLSLDEEQRHQLEKVEASFGQTGIDVIAGIMERNVGSLGLAKIGEVNEPVRAWILRAPSDGGERSQIAA